MFLTWIVVLYKKVMSYDSVSLENIQKCIFS